MLIDPEFLKGKKIVITGVLPVLRKDAEVQIERLGGVCQNAVTRTTDILIVGVLKNRSIKLKKALALKNAGADIVILDGGAVFPKISY